jgi:hypothetical protein
VWSKIAKAIAIAGRISWGFDTLYQVVILNKGLGLFQPCSFMLKKQLPFQFDKFLPPKYLIHFLIAMEVIYLDEISQAVERCLQHV